MKIKILRKEGNILYNLLTMDINKEINLLEKKVKFKLSDEEKKQFIKDLKNFRNAINIFDKFDLSNTKESFNPLNVYNSYLREDDKYENNSFNFLENSKKSKDNFIFLKDSND